MCFPTVMAPLGASKGDGLTPATRVVYIIISKSLLLRARTRTVSFRGMTIDDGDCPSVYYELCEATATVPVRPAPGYLRQE